MNSKVNMIVLVEPICMNYSIAIANKYANGAASKTKIRY